MAEKTIEERLTQTLGRVYELADKVFPIQPEKGVPLPFCVYVSTGAVPDDSLGGFMTSQSARVEINLLHTSYRRMKGLAGEVVKALKGIDYATVYFDSFQPEVYEAEIKAYRKVIYIRLQF